jgi:hypothetical protein
MLAVVVVAVSAGNKVVAIKQNIKGRMRKSNIMLKSNLLNIKTALI